MVDYLWHLGPGVKENIVVGVQGRGKCSSHSWEAKQQTNKQKTKRKELASQYPFPEYTPNGLKTSCWIFQRFHDLTVAPY